MLKFRKRNRWYNLQTPYEFIRSTWVNMPRPIKNIAERITKIYLCTAGRTASLYTCGQLAYVFAIDMSEYPLQKLQACSVHSYSNVVETATNCQFAAFVRIHDLTCSCSVAEPSLCNVVRESWQNDLENVYYGSVFCIRTTSKSGFCYTFWIISEPPIEASAKQTLQFHVHIFFSPTLLVSWPSSQHYGTVLKGLNHKKQVLQSTMFHNSGYAATANINNSIYDATDY